MAREKVTAKKEEATTDKDQAAEKEQKRPKKERGPKIGAGSFGAWIRTGWREIRAALYPDSNVAQQPDAGIWGNRTPGEVMMARQGDSRDPDERPSILGKKLQEAEKARDGREPESPELERE